MAKVDIDAIIPYESYYHERCGELKRVGDGSNALAKCPFHQDETASLSIHVPTGKWSCKAGCGAGNIISFHARIEELDTKTAYADLLQRYGNGPPVPDEQRNYTPPPPKPDPPPQTPPPPPGAEPEINPKILDLLPKFSPETLSYLERVRGWSPEAIEFLGIRYNPEDEKKNLPAEPQGLPSGRIWIPVYDTDGKLRNIRRYRPGLMENKLKSYYDPVSKKTTGKARLYPVNIIKDAPTDAPIILCEGEPDTICALSQGLTAITGTAGAETWRPEYTEFFRDRWVIICYDHDDAGRIGANKAAAALVEVADRVEMILWPDWMPPKGDLTDWVTKHRMTTEDLLGLERQSFRRPADKTTEDQKQKPSSKSSTDADYNSPPVIRKDGAYWGLKWGKEGPSEVCLSNFTMRLVKTIQVSHGGGDVDVIRVVRLATIHGESPLNHEIHSRHMATKQAFCQWLYGRGDYVFRGKLGDLENIWQLEMESAALRPIIRPDHIGYINEHDLWLLGNVAIKDGKAYYPDDDGAIWIGNVGYESSSIVSDESGSTATMLPTIRADLSDDRVDKIRMDMVKLLKANLGGYEAYMALGFVAAACYYEEISRAIKFPVVMVYGKRQCGKNTLGDIIMAHWGLDEGVARNASQTTKAALRRLGSYYSSIPLWIDEYRANDPECQKHDQFIRSCYDRIAAGVSQRDGSGIRNQAVRSPLLITGESFPEDSAQASRIARIQLNQETRQRDILLKIYRLRSELPAITAQIIRRKTKETAKQLIDDIREEQSELEKLGIEPRIATVHAILGAAFARIYNPEDANMDMDKFLLYLRQETSETRADAEESSLLFKFFADLQGMRIAGQLNGSHGKYTYETNEFAFLLHPTYMEWERSCRTRGKDTWTEKDIRKYLKNEKYFAGTKTARFEGVKSNGGLRAVVLSISQMPPEMKNLFSDLEYVPVPTQQ